jgi:hypothetical protein
VLALVLEEVLGLEQRGHLIMEVMAGAGQEWDSTHGSGGAGGGALHTQTEILKKAVVEVYMGLVEEVVPALALVPTASVATVLKELSSLPTLRLHL